MTAIRKVRTVVTGVAGSPYYMTMYMDPGVGTPTQNLANWAQFTTNTVASALRAGAHYQTGPDIDLIDDVDGSLVGRESGTSVLLTGTSSADFLPPQVQLLVRWHTGVFVGGRELVGRTFLPLQSEDNNDASGNPKSAAVTFTQGAANDFIAAANSKPKVWSRKHGLSADISSATVSAIWGTLRSRRAA